MDLVIEFYNGNERIAAEQATCDLINAELVARARLDLHHARHAFIREIGRAQKLIQIVHCDVRP